MKRMVSLSKSDDGRRSVACVAAFLLFACLSITADALASQQQALEPQVVAELPPPHQQWLEQIVGYIISPLEREAFLVLTSNELRDGFINAFWRSRDPTPGTVRNERREEHQERIAYANRYLGTETPRPGWRTDRGRVYIKLGPPADKLTYPDPRSFYPIELWFYRSDPGTSGLPPFFYVMFFRPFQAGEFKMYDPITDGPGALAKDFMLEMADAREIVDRLLTGIGHEVALASINLIPTERTNLNRPRPSARNNFLFAAIEEAPLKGLNDSYAREFVANSGDVEARVVFDIIPLQLSTAAFWDERGLPYLHYGVEVPQEKVLIGEYESEFYLSLDLTVDITDPRGQTVIYGGDDIEEYFDETRAARVVQAPLAYYDRVELVPGFYRIAVTLTNRITDDSAVAETRVSVPNVSDDNIMLSDLLVASSATPVIGAEAAERRAFRFGGEQFTPAPQGRLPVNGTAELFMQMAATPDLGTDTTVEVSAALLTEQGTEVSTTRVAPTSIVPAPELTPLRVSLSLAGADEAPHTIRMVALLSNGQRLLRDARVEIVPAAVFELPEVLVAREDAGDGTSEYQLRGWQHLRKGELRAAEAYFSGGLERDPENIPLRRTLASIEMNLGEYVAAAAIMSPLAQRRGAMGFDLLVYSQALRKAGAPTEAAAVARTLLQANRPTAPAYQALAEALADLGSNAEAIAACELSLALDPDQPEVRELLTRLRELGV
ncbi:MAG TPA: GWxTD domain-containing protein [Acidobacteriota bacterium]|nr:hypothetical protein [Acidobacteriota bacterium]HJN47925.1 GWxTD domain-containing protein [Acidobacteriota bacterium]